jgi:hypothetical protein
VNGEHRALQDIRPLFGEQAGELRLLARFQDEDAISVELVGHDPALVFASDLFILTRSRPLAQECRR